MGKERTRALLLEQHLEQEFDDIWGVDIPAETLRTWLDENEDVVVEHTVEGENTTVLTRAKFSGETAFDAASRWTRDNTRFSAALFGWPAR
jgi:hypothetical protein